MLNYKCNLCAYRCEAGVLRGHPCDPIKQKSGKDTINEKENKKNIN